MSCLLSGLSRHRSRPCHAYSEYARPIGSLALQTKRARVNTARSYCGPPLRVSGLTEKVGSLMGRIERSALAEQSKQRYKDGAAKCRHAA